MHSMTQEHPIIVIGGVDAHADAHHFAALDERGALLGSASFPATTAGYAAALQWLRGHGHLDRVAVESTGSYAAGLVRHLRAHDVAIVEVNQPHPHARRRVGKSDPIDAELAARALLAGTARAMPKQTDGMVEAIRLLRVAREGAVKARTAATLQLGDLIITAPAALRERLAARKTLRGRASVCARFRVAHADGRADPAIAAKLALRSIAHRIQSLDDEIAGLDRELENLVAQAAPRTIKLLGISTGHAGQLLTTAGQTSTGSPAKPRSPRCAAPARSQHPRARPAAIASTPEVTATPTAPFTSSPSCACATANKPAPTPSAAPARASPSARSSGA